MSAAKSSTKVKAAFKFQTSFRLLIYLHKIYNLFESSNELMALFSSIDKALITKTHKVNLQRLRYNILSIFLVLAKNVLHAVSHANVLHTLKPYRIKANSIQVIAFSDMNIIKFLGTIVYINISSVVEV